MIVKFKRLHPDAIAPTKAHDTDAGFDLFCIERLEEQDESTQFTYVYRSGVAVEIPIGYFGLLVPRSSVYKTNQALANCVGIIDSGYRGEVVARYSRVSAISNPYRRGDRFAQLLILPLPAVELVEVDELNASDRGTGGFGSSGK